MDLDKEYSQEPDLLLATIINEWLGNEQLREFHIVYPRMTDTIARGLEGWIQYNHRPDGYASLATIYHDRVYLEYENADLLASDPEFFTKLKATLRRYEAMHSKCNHLRSPND